MEISKLNRGFVQPVTCPFEGCQHKTHGHLTARDTIVCHWCGKLFEDKEHGIDLFPNVERKKRWDFS